jgi:hypothetical protein
MNPWWLIPDAVVSFCLGAIFACYMQREVDKWTRHIPDDGFRHVPKRRGRL